MNDRDKENLAFLLSASPETIKEWYEKISEDDREYASEIMHAHSIELNKKGQELAKKQRENDLEIEFETNALLELKLEALGENYVQARRILKKIALKK